MNLYERFVRDLTRASALPTQPDLLGRLVTALAAEDTGLREIAALVRQDPVLTGQVIRVANSSAYAPRREIAAVADALLRIGLVQTRRLVLALALRNMVAGPGLLEIQAGFWQHSLGVAHAAELLARRAGAAGGLGAEEGYLLGLVHDVGLLGLAGYEPEALERVRRFAARSELPRYAAEPPVLGTHHGALGAALCRHWRLPAVVERVVAAHHGLEELPEELAPAVELLRLAERLSEEAGVEGLNEGWFTPVDALSLDAVGLREGDLAELLWELRGALEHTGAALAAL
jgi:putative nucleotidyltransferase with HDIG domain